MSSAQAVSETNVTLGSREGALAEAGVVEEEVERDRFGAGGERCIRRENSVRNSRRYCERTSYTFTKFLTIRNSKERCLSYCYSMWQVG